MHKMKWNSILTVFLSLLLSLATALSAFAQSQGETKLDIAKYRQVLEKMVLIEQIIDERYLFDWGQKELTDGIYSGMMNSLSDPYSVYYNQEELDELINSTKGEYFGIGIGATQDESTGMITISTVYPNTPAFEKGMLPGDILQKVNGTDVTGMDLELVVNRYIKGGEGEPVTITVFRPSLNKSVSVTMNRKRFEIETVSYEMIDDKIGYIQVREFDTVTADQFVSAIELLEKKGMEKAIIDLRNNPGGVLESAVSMLAYVLPEGMISYTEDKNGEGILFKTEDGFLVKGIYPESSAITKKTIAEDKHQLDIPIVILVNEYSASASEVFTGAIKDYKWGTIVGTTTFGKGIVQEVIPLGDGTAVKVTAAHYYTPNGFDLHGKGIIPDIQIELKEELKTKRVITMEEDNQLQEAIKILKEK